MTQRFDPSAEWLEADGLGGFASGTVGGVRTRRYHGLLLTATSPPTGRMLLVSGFEAWIQTPGGSFALVSQRYAPGVTHPSAVCELESFDTEPWPTWVLRLPDAARIQHEVFACHAAPLVAVSWRLLDAEQPSSAAGADRRSAVTLCVPPFLCGRDYHALHHENPALRFEPRPQDGCLVWQTYAGVPAVVSCSNAEYRHEPHWYRHFHYEQERERGLDHVEDLAAPGVLRWNLSAGEAVWLLGAGPGGRQAIPHPSDAVRSLAALRSAEHKRRARFASPLHRAADAYLVQRGKGKTIVAGYPWFTDWGRDTFIALRGLCLAIGRFDEAREILLEWSGAVSDGMLPNRFPDAGETPEYNSVDASLWYVIAVHEFLAAADAGRTRLTRDERKRLEGSVQAILTGYETGTRFGIRCDDDGLLAAGQPGVQLTWMDAKVGEWVVTPRIGKPVEVQALWLNALWSARHLSDHWADLLVRGRHSFRSRFWNERHGYLYDVVDCDHRPGSVDPKFRPNQIFAVGGLPIVLLDNGRARRIVAAVEERLWTPLGLRSLAPDEMEFVPYYRGGVRERDGAYHQGTAWPWLAGPFVEAWLRVHGNTAEARRQARTRFVAPLREHLNHAGLGHVSEVADGAAPHVPGGCPFQAWSLSELLRLEHALLADGRAGRSQTSRAAPAALAAVPRPVLRQT